MKDINEIINSCAEYIDNVCKLNRTIYEKHIWDDEALLFRGQSNKDYELIPSLGRGRNFACDCTIFNEERNLIEMAKYRMPDIFHKDLLPIELLSLLQHHGIPTRLLDVTQNALVALYFACVGNENNDGEIIVFKETTIDVTNYPVVNAIADTYRFAHGTWTPLDSFYEAVIKQPYFAEQISVLALAHKDKEIGGRWIMNCCKEIMYIHAPIRSMRQQLQQGRYILFPNYINEEEERFEKRLSAIPKSHNDIVARYIIPKEKKEIFLKDLSLLGISKDFLFSDNIDSVCEGVLNKFKRKYY